MIHDHDISIVVQGPILKSSLYDMTNQTTQFICQRLKHLMPESELIISTWLGEQVAHLPYDQCVLNTDPGATWFNYGDHQLLNNCNRLIASTRAGIAAAQRPYILKIRSDLFMVSKKFLNYFYKFPHFDPRYKFVKDRIIAFSLDTIKSHRTPMLMNPAFRMHRPFHISDWAYFGHRGDLWNLFDIPLVEEPEFSQWFLTRFKPFLDMEPHRLWKMPPEQYITVSFLKKFANIKFEHTNDTAHDNINLSEKMLTNNFLVLDQTQFSLISLKYIKLQLLFPTLLNKTAIFYHTWLQDYLKHCDVPRSVNYYRNKVTIKWRCLAYNVTNKLLRLINHKTHYINRVVAYYIKRSRL